MASYNTGTTFTLGGVTHTTAFTGTVPAGVLTNDVMICAVMVFTFSGGTPGFTTPTSGGGNWTQIGTTLHSVQGGFDCYALTFYRVATASDASSTFSISYNGTPGGTDDFFWAADLESYTGFYTASPIGNVATVANINATTMTAPSTTTARATSWAVYTCQVAVNGSGTITGEPTTNRHVTGVSGIDAGISDSAGSAGAAGSSIGGGTWTFSNSSGGGAAGFTIELCTVAPAAAVTAAPTPPRIPHPLWYELLEVAQSRADWQAQGVASLQQQHWRLMDGVNGRPGVSSSGTQPPGTATGSGTNVVGTTFYVTQGGMWFEGFWWYVAASGAQSTSAQKFCLYAYYSGPGAAVVPGSVVTSGTLSQGWNYIPLPQPVQLAIWGTYGAATGLTGTYPQTATQTGTGNAYRNGFSNGPLTAFSDAGAGNAPPYTIGNGVIASGASSTDPALTVPTGDLGAGTLVWLDVQVTNTAPAAYNGSYRLWPNMLDGDFATVADSSVNYVLGTEVQLSQPCVVNAIWYYIPSGQGSSNNQWATSADIWNVRTGARVATQGSPVWLKPFTGGADGNSNSGRWVYTQLPGTVTLPAGDYYVTVYNSNGSPNGWSAKRLGYWQAYNQAPAGTYLTNPPGVNGITTGPMYAPTTPAASDIADFSSPSVVAPGQSVFATGPPNQFPTSYVGTPTPLFQNYWIDLEVTPASTYQPNLPVLPQRIPHPQFYALLEDAAYRQQRNGLLASSGVTIQGTASLTAAGSMATAGVQGVIASAAGAGTVAANVTQSAPVTLAGTGTLSALATQLGSAALAGAGVINANSGASVQGAATLTGAGVLSVPAAVQQAGASLASGGTLTATAGIGAGASLTGAGVVTPPPPPFQVGRSTSAGTDPRDGTPSVTGPDTSASGVS